MSKKNITKIFIILLSLLFLISCSKKIPKLNVEKENIKDIEISVLPSLVEKEIVTDNVIIESTIKYLNSLNLNTTKSQDIYDGKTIVIKINYTDNTSRTFFQMNDKFIREGNGELFEFQLTSNN